MTAVVVDQFTRQAASFARLPSHEASTELLLDLAGVAGATAMLDVACGPGMVACAAAKRARHVTGIDLTSAMIEQARSLQAKLGLSNLEWRLGEAVALPFEDASFDAVTTRYSCHHFPDPDLVLAEIVRVARPGARVAVADMVLPRAQGAAYDRMERLKRSSFPAPGDAERVRAMFEADVGLDRMGLALTREQGEIALTYPVTIVAGSV